MGVPKFFRYISERYPCLSETLKDYQIPEFDNLYLDMNGIIHNCSHPNDGDVHFRITEETIFQNIFHYIEVLFRMVQPQKLFFMAVDGVAPRAKINQQRSRRFRSAKEAEMADAKALQKKIELPTEKRFDSNCITPGTLFMAKLNEQLRYFISYKISTDKQWQKCKIILSGSEVPGEGEHKIMDYIRYMKSKSDYDPDTRHCLYGLDADLIMLGLCTHEPHFSLLREEVKFGKKQKKILTPEETKFCLLHLSVLREYIEHEFSLLKTKIQFDIEKIIDDWVLMGFLVGNDFIPHLPNLHIAQGALPVLYHAYMEVMPMLDGYINEAGTLKLDRFEKFMEKLSRIDTEQFAEHYADLKFFESKTGRSINETERHSYRKSDNCESSTPDEISSPRKTVNKDLSALIKCTDDLLLEQFQGDDYSDDDSDSDTYEEEFIQHKRDYYMNKLEYKNVDEEVLRSQAEGYVRAIQWNLYYYYNGCCSWSWYYPHHYAPYISDIKDFKDLKLEFDLDEPFLPFQQLLAVLPAYSKELLPEAFHSLLTAEESPIIGYYPVDFKTDLNGKKQEWEAVVLIPFIDEVLLVKAMEPHCHKLTEDEKKRNMHGPMCVFTYSSTDFGVYKAPAYFPDLRNNYAKMEMIDREDIVVPVEKLVKGLPPNIRLDVFFPGFPSLKFINHTAKLEKAKVKVFEQPSRGDNMILYIDPIETPDIQEVAKELLGKIIYVNWPHLSEALVVGVQDSNVKYNLSRKENQKSIEQNQSSTENVVGALPSQTNSYKRIITDTYKGRFGIEIGETEIIIHARPLIGAKYIFGNHGKLALEKKWNDVSSVYAYQMILRDISIFSSKTPIYNSVTDVFVPGDVCFMMGFPYYASKAKVIDATICIKTKRIKVSLEIPLVPILNKIKQELTQLKTSYMYGNIAAQRLGISSHLLSRVTGAIYVTTNSLESMEMSKHNIGLNLKFNKRNEEIPGFTKKENGQWLYSSKAVELLRNYIGEYPNLFERLATNVSNDIYQAAELFDDETQNLSNVVTWLKDQEHHSIESRTCGAEILDAEIVQKIEKKLDEYKKDIADSKTKTIEMNVKPHLLFKPGLHLKILPPDPDAKHYLLDRIICVRDSFTVPLGLKGIIIGIQKADNLIDTSYDVIFDESFVGGLTFNGCSKCRGYRLSSADFMNISYGNRMENQKTGADQIRPKTKNNPVEEQQTTWRRCQNQPLQVQRTDQPVEGSWRRSDNVPNNKLPGNMPWVKSQSVQNQQHKNLIMRPEWATPRPQGSTNQSQQRTSTSAFASFNKSNVDANSPKHQSTLTIMKNNNKSSKTIGNNKESTKSDEKPPKSNKLEPTEFQALWNELQKLQKPTSFPGVPPMPAFTKPGETSKKDQGNPPQDPSAYLKAVLKISDENVPKRVSDSSTTQTSISKNFPPPPQHNPSGAPPLVQQLFDHARRNENKRDEKNSVWYCTQLLNYCQLRGMGMPVYTYRPDDQNKTVVAQIHFPNRRIFVGEPCVNYEQAAENVAKKVYEELNLGKACAPDMKMLRPPPQQWWNSQHGMAWSQNTRPPVMPPCGSKLPPNPGMQFPKWTPNTQLNSTVTQMYPKNSQNKQQQKPNESKRSSKKNNTFVPLQAQKKSRASNPRENIKDTSTSDKNIKIAPNHSTSSQHKNLPLPKAIEVEGSNKNLEKSSNIEKPQTSQKSQNTNRPRRSRVAAKFCSTPAINGDEGQQK